MRLVPRAHAPHCPALCAAPQQDYAGAAVNSGILAGMPNHPVWEKAWELMEERKGKGERQGGKARGPQGVQLAGLSPLPALASLHLTACLSASQKLGRYPREPAPRKPSLLGPCPANLRPHPVHALSFPLHADHDPNDTGHSTGPQIVRDMIARWHGIAPGGPCRKAPALPAGPGCKQLRLEAHMQARCGGGHLHACSEAPAERLSSCAPVPAFHVIKVLLPSWGLAFLCPQMPAGSSQKRWRRTG